MATRARHFEAALAGFRNNSGASLSGGKLQFYVSGTSTPKNAYTDREKTQPVTGVTLDSNGRAEVFGDGWYDIKLLDATDAVLDTFEYVYLQRASFTVETKTESFTATTDVDVYLVDTTNGDVVVSYPPAADIEYPIEISKKTDDANTVTIDPYGSETINGETSFVLDAPNQSVMVASDGANLFTLGAFVNTAVTITTEATTSVQGKTRYATANEAKQLTEEAAAITPGAMADIFDILGVSHYGLSLANNVADSAHDIDIAAGVCKDSTNAKFITLSSALTKQIDVDWAQGSAAGGFPSGLTLETSVVDRANSTAYSLGAKIRADYSPWWWECTTAGTSASSQPAGYGASASPVTDGTAVFTAIAPEWYRVFLIASSDVSTVDAGFDTAANASNLLADATNFSLYRQIGWVLNNGAGSIVAFKMEADGLVLWDVPKRDTLTPAATTSATLYRCSVPPGTRALLNIALTVSAGTIGPLYGLFLNPSHTDTVPSQTTCNVMAFRDTASTQYFNHEARIVTDTSSRIRTRMDSTVPSIRIMTIGYDYLWD